MKTLDARFRETSDSLKTEAMKHSLLSFPFPVDIMTCVTSTPLSSSFPFNFNVTSIPSDIRIHVYYSLAVSLGEEIARKAATADIITQDDSCQTSPVLLQSLKRSLNNRVERATNPHSVWRKPQPSKPGQLF